MTGDELNELNEGLPWWVKKKIIDSRRQSHPAPPPPPAPPRYPCSTSEPQSPRNVSKDFVGLLPPKVQPVGSWMKGNILVFQELVMWLDTWEEHPDFSSTVVQRCCELKSIECLGRVWNHFRGLYDEFPNLIHVNTHFHLGGEHQNVDEGGYSAPVNQGPPGNDTWSLDDYHWTSCKNVKMGYTYEFHWVHSTAGPIDRVLSCGLGGVFNRSINPTAFVRGQICRIVNWPEQEYKMFNTTWREPVRDSMVYIGSTTGTSYDNYKCSPAEVTWLVDRECCILSAQNMDRMCADLLEYGRNMGGDVQPAPSPLLVAPFISDTNASFIANYTSTWVWRQFWWK